MRTAAVLTALKAEIPALRVLRHGRNLGQSRGIRTGVRAARGDIIVTLDGDGQNDPADIPKLLAACCGAEPDVGHGVGRARQAPGQGQPAAGLAAGQRLAQRPAWATAPPTPAAA